MMRRSIVIVGAMLPVTAAVIAAVKPGFALGLPCGGEGGGVGLCAAIAFGNV